MNRKTLDSIQRLYGRNFIGPNQVNKMLSVMGLPLFSEGCIPDMNYPRDVLEDKANGYLLVLGFTGVENKPLNTLQFTDTFGVDPEKGEPCFYNQDWYLHEDFVQKTLETKWFLIKKDVFEESRAVMPEQLLKANILFPSAILCIYTFFAYYFSYGEFLWYHDFVWCDDFDHNGDRVYVGKYNDVDGLNKNGFSIHRYLALRSCYSSINVL